MNKITMVLLAIIMAAVPKTNVQAAAEVASTVTSDSTPSISVDLQLVPNQVDLLEVASITLSNVVVDPEVKKPKTIRQKANELVAQAFGSAQVTPFAAIVQKESNWNPNAVNPSSGACGLGQALPCSKIGPDRSVEGQLDWMISYIEDRYGTPAEAWEFWQRHHWY